MRTALKIVAFAAAIVAVGLALWIFKNRFWQVAHLPDGSTLKVLGTSVGLAQFTSEKPIHRLAKQVLPPRLQRWLPSPFTSSCGGSSNSITVYVRHLGVSAGATPCGLTSGEMTVDDDGFRLPTGGGNCSSGFGTAQEVHGLVLHTYPRRQRSFNLLFLGPHNEQVAALRILNPLQGPFPEWVPDRLPITRTNGPLILTLKSLRRRDSSRSYTWVDPEFQIQAPDGRWQSAAVNTGPFKDATGNEGPFLSPKEHAWKFIATVHRQRREDFADDERFRWSNVTIPQAGIFQPIDLSTNVQGITFSVHGLAGPGRLIITNGTTRIMMAADSNVTSERSSGSMCTNRWESWTSSRPFFFLEASGLQPNQQLRFSLCSEDGREVEAVTTQDGKPAKPNTWIYHVKFVPRPDMKRVSLEVTVSRGIEFEFLIDPKEIHSPNPSNQ